MDDFTSPRPAAPADVKHLFAGVSPEILEKLVLHGTVYRAQSNVALRAQDNNESDPEAVPLQYILDGHMHVELEKNGRSVVVSTLGPGELCGEVENVLHCASGFTIVSMGFVTYVEIEPSNLLFDIADDRLHRNLYAAVCRKLKQRAGRVVLQRSRNAASLVNEYLTILAREVGTEEDSAKLRCKTSLYELALQIGLSRQSIRNAFNQMTDFSYAKKRITVNSSVLLKELRRGGRSKS